ncbi:MAG: peptidylprolyl isomerase [Pyrinomonadaceae bacterium]
MKKFFIYLTAVGLLLSAVSASAQNKPAEKPPEKKANQRPPETKKKEPYDDADVKTMAAQCVTLETEKGNITMELFPESAPETVRNFLNLTALGIFDTTTFSRVVPGFIIQGGNVGTRENRTREQTIRAQKTIPDEPNQIKHESGIVSMARPEEPNGASSNFFILLRSADYLDGSFAAFGRVIRGMEVVEAINRMEVEEEKPKNPVRVNRAVAAPCPADNAEENPTKSDGV